MSKEKPPELSISFKIARQYAYGQSETERRLLVGVIDSAILDAKIAGLERACEVLENDLHSDAWARACRLIRAEAARLRERGKEK